ncbi:MAG: hypothetical protein ACREQM_14685 [Candidatus Dormibacteraceae bacterium]
MIFLLELFVPAGRFTRDQRRDLAGRLTLSQLLTHVDELGGVLDAAVATEAASADLGVLTMLEEYCHVVVHEVDTWVVGRRTVEGPSAGRYVARVYVPGPWRSSMASFLIGSITHVLTKFDPDGSGLAEEPLVEVAVLGVPEGGYGVRGRVAKESDVLDLISAARENRQRTTPEGKLIDPVCGMIAVEGLTLEHDGTVYGFCSDGCRRHFAAGLATSS